MCLRTEEQLALLILNQVPALILVSLAFLVQVEVIIFFVKEI